jgi:pilus assembly protein FimV
MKRAVRRALFLSALAAPSALYALGLGEIRLNSALNQPFDAEIELVSATSDDLSALTAALAPSDTFQRYGLDKPAFLSDFSFRVARSGGRDVLKITSPRPVTEPFVTLLVEASWPRGRLLREYTVLLDPPTMAPATVAAAPTPAPTRSTLDFGSRTISAPTVPESVSRTRSSAERAVGATHSTPASIDPGSTYQVRPNDTLWRIASATGAGPKSEVNRMMVAIYQANPTAFGGNINVLRAGSELRIPTTAEASAISASAAADEVARQYRLWTEGSASGAATSEAAGRLRLVTPEQGSAAPSVAAAAPAVPQAGTTTEPAAGAASTVELQARLERLESELAEARRMLEVRNAELATLQGGTAAPAAEPGVETAGTEEAAAPAAEPQPSESPAAAEPAPAAQPEEAVPPKKAKRAKAPAEPSLFDRLREYWWALLLPLLIALGAVFWSRRRREAEPEEDDLEEALAPRATEDLRARPTAKRGEPNILVEERHAAEPVVAAAAAASKADAGRRATTVADTISGDGPVSIEAGDPLAEADFHMAYGLYDQAADLVQLALKREPQRRDLMLKLVEIFFVWGNRDRFLETARQMYATRGQAKAGEWDKVLIMGRQIAADDELFADKTLSTAASLDLELQGGASTTDFELPEAGAAPVDLEFTAVAPEVRGEDSVDFLLDEPERGGPEGSSLSPTIEAAAMRPSSDEATAELEIEELGLETGDVEGLDSTMAERRGNDIDATVEQTMAERRSLVEDTVQQDMSKRGVGYEDTVEEDMSKRRSAFEETVEQPVVRSTEEAPEKDLLSATSMLKVDLEELGKQVLDEVTDSGTEIIDLSGPTGEMPAIDLSDLEDTGEVAQIDLKGDSDITMSEVGTKLDLARAYIDMGDPEGARSILDEVLKEGNAGHKQEAERLMSGLP